MPCRRRWRGSCSPWCWCSWHSRCLQHSAGSACWERCPCMRLRPDQHAGQAGPRCPSRQVPQHACVLWLHCHTRPQRMSSVRHAAKLPASSSHRCCQTRIRSSWEGCCPMFWARGRRSWQRTFHTPSQRSLAGTLQAAGTMHPRVSAVHGGPEGDGSGCTVVQQWLLARRQPPAPRFTRGLDQPSLHQESRRMARRALVARCHPPQVLVALFHRRVGPQLQLLSFWPHLWQATVPR
jgi:hypothetical protein